MQEHVRIAVAILAALFIGLSKAGFGGGLGMLTTPLCVLAFGPRDAIGILLPLLCAGDLFSMYHYWGKWERKNLLYLLPGVVVGVVIGVQLIGRFSARELNLAIGLLAVAFVTFQLVKEAVFRAEGAFEPSHTVGIPCGIASGITSTFAHGAGPVVSMFLIPQRLPKVMYVGTTVLVFTWINWIKLPFYCLDRDWVDWTWVPSEGIINWHTLRSSALLMPVVPIGVWLGVWLNRKFSEEGFFKVIYALVFLAGVQLIFNFDLTKLVPR
ncbi:MAG TPA: sulfite exporter TauE/SafE family protein [Verrucomicrobiota bacterium]|nr:sulfite exporter TauE/SafE family protein [Verrucomicrobiota bacterium]HRZ36935.1 sulfite exporter TauE/SafE family protein [Candidatus Paceibacterota bacterium]HRZ58196.1 sulfite exporter TauE/SafE family protein [Candidatus Paceibacterota bacterium]